MKMSFFKCSENIQKKEGWTDRSVPNNQFSSVTLNRNMFSCYRMYWLLVIAAVLIAVIYVIVEIAIKSPRNLISIAGMAVYILLFYIFSHNPAKVYL